MNRARVASWIGACVIVAAPLAAGCTDVGDSSAVSDPSAAEETGVQDSAAEETGVRDSAAEETGVQDSAAEETGVQDSAVEETGVQDSAVEEADESAAEDTGTLDATVEDTGAGAQDSPVEGTGAGDAGKPADTGTPEETGSPDSSIDDSGTLFVDTGTASDGTLDSAVAESGIGEAMAADASHGGETLLPCTTAAQTSCVPCAGNATGVCTPAEAAFVQHDIDDGNASGDGGDGDNGCYACLLMAGCLDDTEYGDHGIECGDLTGTFNAGAQAGTADSTLCLATLACILQTSCASGEAVSSCYCGPTHAGSACAAAGNAVDGACLTPEVNGLGFGVSDNTDILKNFDDNTRPTGMANQTFQCAVANTCTSCLQ
jgi:hypothetical protein